MWIDAGGSSNEGDRHGRLQRGFQTCDATEAERFASSPTNVGSHATATGTGKARPIVDYAIGHLYDIEFSLVEGKPSIRREWGMWGSLQKSSGY
jgi:hypothetical protein